MWKNGRNPITRSSAPTSRHVGELQPCSATRFRCVSITPFGSPVVPLEYGSDDEVVRAVDLGLRRRRLRGEQRRERRRPLRLAEDEDLLDAGLGGGRQGAVEELRDRDQEARVRVAQLERQLVRVGERVDRRVGRAGLRDAVEGDRVLRHVGREDADDLVLPQAALDQARAQRPTRWSSIAYEYERPVEPQTIVVRSPREAASAYTNWANGTSGISTSGYGLRMLVAIVCSSSRSVCAPAIVPLRGTPRKGVVPFGHAEAGVVTGASAISPIGNGREELWDSLQAMRSGASRIDLPGFGSMVAFMSPPDGAEERFGRKAARRMDRAGRLAAVTAAMALEDAGDLGLESRDIGTAIGSAHGGAETLHEAYETFYLRGADRLSPFAIPLSLPNTAASAVARENNLHGP